MNPSYHWKNAVLIPGMCCIWMIGLGVAELDASDHEPDSSTTTMFTRLKVSSKPPVKSSPSTRRHHLSQHSKSHESLGSATTFSTVATSASDHCVPVKAPVTPIQSSHQVQRSNGYCKPYIFDYCSSDYFPDAIAVAALAAGDQYLELRREAKTGLKHTYSEEVTVQTEDNMMCSYDMTESSAEKRCDYAELGLQMMAREKHYAVQMLVKLTPQGGAILEKVHNTTKTLNGYPEQLSSTVYYTECRDSYFPGLLLIPCPRHAMSYLIVALRERDTLFKQNVLGTEHDFVKVTPQELLPEQDLIILSLALARCILEIYQESYEFEQPPALKDFCLHDTTHPVFIRPQHLRPKKPATTEIDRVTATAGNGAAAPCQTCPRSEVIYWLGGVFAMLAGVDNIYILELRAKLNAHDSNYVQVCEALRKTPYKQHVTDHLDTACSKWGELKKSGVVPRVKTKLPPKVHLLALASYMLREKATNRPTINQVADYLLAVVKKHQIPVDLP
ncbi:hypothetical protein [Spongorhabdus nitratireducens]